MKTEVASLAALAAAEAVGRLLVSIADEPEPAAGPQALAPGSSTRPFQALQLMPSSIQNQVVGRLPAKEDA